MDQLIEFLTVSWIIHSQFEYWFSSTFIKEIHLSAYMLMGAKSKMLALHNSFILFYCYSLGPYNQLGFGGLAMESFLCILQA